MLDQLLADEWRHVGMVEQTVECRGACGRAAGAGRNADAEEAARAGFMLRGVDRHRQLHPVRRRVVGIGEGVAGPHLRALRDVGLCVGGHGIAAGHDQRAVHIELIQADGEQLHQFARVVLIRYRPGRWIGLDAAEEGQVQAHGDAGGYTLHEIAIIAKRALPQHVEVRCHHERPPAAGEPVDAHHPLVEQRQSHALAQDVAAAHELRPDHRVEAIERVDVGRGGVAVGDQKVPELLRSRHRELGG